jgi:hypothetical protein
MTSAEIRWKHCRMNKMIDFAILGLMLIAGTARVMSIEPQQANVCSGPNY